MKDIRFIQDLIVVLAFGISWREYYYDRPTNAIYFVLLGIAAMYFIDRLDFYLEFEDEEDEVEWP